MEGPVIFLGRSRTPGGLLEADEELGIVLPVAHLVGTQRLGRACIQVALQILLGIARQAQVARQAGGQQAQVGQALNVAVAAQRVDTSTQLANVAQQQLHHGSGTDDLRAHAVLGPAQCIQDRHHAVGRRGAADHLGYLQELVLGRPGYLLHHFRRVAAVVLLHDLQHAARMLHGRIGLGVIAFLLVGPAAVVVGALLFVVAGEDAIGKAVTLVHDERSIGVVPDVFGLDLVIAEQVVDDACQEGDVGTSANRRVVIGYCS